MQRFDRIRSEFVFIKALILRENRALHLFVLSGQMAGLVGFIMKVSEVPEVMSLAKDQQMSTCAC